MIKSLYTFFGFYSSTPLSLFSDKELKYIIKVCRKYCVHNLGVNNRKKYKLSVVVEKNPFEELYYGLYCPVVIRLVYTGTTLRPWGISPVHLFMSTHTPYNRVVLSTLRCWMNMVMINTPLRLRLDRMK